MYDGVRGQKFISRIVAKPWLPGSGDKDPEAEDFSRSSVLKCNAALV